MISRKNENLMVNSKKEEKNKFVYKKKHGGKQHINTKWTPNGPFQYLFKNFVTLSLHPLHVIHLEEEAKDFIRSCYCNELLEIYPNYWANALLCKNIENRAQVLASRIKDQIVCMQSAAWVYKAIPSKTLTLHHIEHTHISHQLSVTDHSIFPHHLKRIGNLIITSPERTIIDICRYRFPDVANYAVSFKNIKEPYCINKDKIEEIFEELIDIKLTGINNSYNMLRKHGYIR